MDEYELWPLSHYRLYLNEMMWNSALRQIQMFSEKKTYFLMLPGSSVAFSLFKCSCYVPLHQLLIGFVLPSLCQCWGGV